MTDKIGIIDLELEMRFPLHTVKISMKIFLGFSLFRHNSSLKGKKKSITSQVRLVSEWSSEIYVLTKLLPVCIVEALCPSSLRIPGFPGERQVAHKEFDQ